MSLLKPALLCLCLCGLAAAQPIRFEDEQTGFIWITDKKVGEQVIMSSQRLIFLNTNGRNWQIQIPEARGTYLPAIIGDNGVFVAIYGERKIVKYAKSGNLIWEYTADNGPYIFIYALWEEEGYIGAMMHGSDAISATTYQVISTQDGKSVSQPNMRRIIGVSETAFLRVWNQSDTLLQDDNFDQYKYQLANMTILPYSVEDRRGKDRNTIFRTPPRSNCGDLKFSNSLEEFQETSLWNYPQADVRGEYIYAHRADECGKFTYKFHWTDANNPAPEILDGWQ